MPKSCGNLAYNSLLFSYSAAGISRSVTLCTVYLMTATSLSYEDAMTIMVYARSMAGPNFGFRMQMMKYTKTILNDVSKYYYY